MTMQTGMMMTTMTMILQMWMLLLMMMMILQTWMPMMTLQTTRLLMLPKRMPKQLRAVHYSSPLSVPDELLRAPSCVWDTHEASPDSRGCSEPNKPSRDPTGNSWRDVQQPRQAASA
jgi:hypothetical protein